MYLTNFKRFYYFCRKEGQREEIKGGGRKKAPKHRQAAGDITRAIQEETNWDFFKLI